MKRFDRFVLRQFAAAYLAAAGFFSGIYFLLHLSANARRIDRAWEGLEASGQDPFWGVASYYLLNVPFVVVLVGPFSVMAACLWAARSIVSRGEVLALVASGVSRARVGLPFIVCTLLLSGGLSWLRLEGLPALAEERFRLERSFKGDTKGLIDSLPLMSDGRGHNIIARAYDPSARILYDVTFWSANHQDAERYEASQLQWFDADQPQAMRGAGWYLSEQGEERGPKAFLMEVRLLPADLDLERRVGMVSGPSDIEQRLARHPKRPSLWMAWHGHFAYPVSVLALTLFTLPLVLTAERNAGWSAAGVGLATSLIYFTLERILADLGVREAAVSPAIAAWAPAMLFIIGAWASMRLSR